MTLLPVSTATRRLVKIAIACALVALLVATIDVSRVALAIARLQWMPLGVALALFVPQVVVSAVRWREWIAPLERITLAESVRQTLAASALNLVLPAKLGDLSKAAMLDVDESNQQANVRSRAMFRATAEKLTDVAILASFIVAGVLGIASAGVVVGCVVLFVLARIARRREASSLKTMSEWMYLTAWTIVLWSLHLAQLHLFLQAAGVVVPWETTATKMPIAIFAGLLPVSYCGIGTRDAALVAVFSDVAPAASMLVVGMLTALRYFIPGAIGIAMLGRYLPKLSNRNAPQNKTTNSPGIFGSIVGRRPVSQYDRPQEVETLR